MRAADVMVTKVITVRRETRIDEIAEVLLANRISAVPVVDDDGHVVGIVSEGDLIHRVEVGTERRRRSWLELLTPRQALELDFIKSHARKAADLMTRPVITVAPETPLSDIVTTLEKHKIKRVPVVADGKLVGIISRANLVEALLKTRAVASPKTAIKDAELHSSIDKLLRAQPWWPTDISVIVNDGVVELWGAVNSELEKDAIRVAVEIVPGVQRISNRLAVSKYVPRAV